MPNKSRRVWLLYAAACVPFAAGLFAAETATLAETLKAGLKCRRQLEKDFVDEVVNLVNTGKLPKDIVLNTFDYAKKKREDIPFPYFQTALRLRAAKLGVSL